MRRIIALFPLALTACLAQPEAELFPEWLEWDSQKLERRTHLEEIEGGWRSIYEDRYVHTLKKWPHTTEGFQRQETYLDCETLNLKREYTTTAGEKGGSTSTLADPAVSENTHRITYGRICEDLGLR